MPYKDKEKQKAAVAKQKRDLRDFFWGVRKKLVCVRCGFRNPCALQFHHPDDNKSHTVSRMVDCGWSPWRILGEMFKCEVLCANCHCIEHRSQYLCDS